MSLFLSVHALKQMDRRGITRDEVEQALAVPDTTFVSTEDKSCTVILGRKAAGRPLKVIVPAGDPTYIVTVARHVEEG